MQLRRFWINAFDWDINFYEKNPFVITFWVVSQNEPP